MKTSNPTSDFMSRKFYRFTENVFIYFQEGITYTIQAIIPVPVWKYPKQKVVPSEPILYKEGQEQRNSNAAQNLNFVICQVLSHAIWTGKGQED